MAVTFNKPANLKYTDLAIYIDANAYKIKNTGEYPGVESKIYEYLYHLIYALSWKANYFRQFEDYDYFACYGAAEVMMAMRKKLVNEGKEVRGKKVIPVKSSLNFVKATLFPLKINYQKSTFGEIIDPAIHKNTETLKTNLTEAIQQQYRLAPEAVYEETAAEIPGIIRSVIKNTPFRNDKSFCLKLYLSILLTLINDITLPTKIYNRMINRLEKQSRLKNTKLIDNNYTKNVGPCLLWHLDESFQGYVRVLTTKVKTLIAKTFDEIRHSGELSDELLERLMRNSYGDVDEREDAQINVN